MKSTKKVGLHLNTEKTQHIEVNRELGNVPITKTINVGHYEFKKVEHSKYLGFMVTQKNECQIEVQQRIKMENGKATELLSFRVLLIEV